jgi:hypothetical protein
MDRARLLLRSGVGAGSPEFGSYGEPDRPAERGGYRGAVPCATARAPSAKSRAAGSGLRSASRTSTTGRRIDKVLAALVRPDAALAARRPGIGPSPRAEVSSQLPPECPAAGHCSDGDIELCRMHSKPDGPGMPLARRALPRRSIPAGLRPDRSSSCPFRSDGLWPAEQKEGAGRCCAGSTLPGARTWAGSGCRRHAARMSTPPS